MNKIEKLTQAITDFFSVNGTRYGYDEETITEMLRTIDFQALHRFVHREADTVPAFRSGGGMPDILRYRGSNLLPHKAVCVYSSYDFIIEHHFIEQEHSLELWLTEDMTIAVTSCMMNDCGDGALFSEYRELKGDKWPDYDVSLDLDELLEAIHAICSADDELHIYEP